MPDGAGGWLISDTGGSTIRRLWSNRTMTTVAGILRCSANNACFNSPAGIASDGQGGFYIADQKNSQIRRLFSNRSVALFAGNGSAGLPVDGPAAQGRLNNPAGVCSDGAGGVWIADTLNHAVRFVSSAGVLSTLGSAAGTPGYAGAEVPSKPRATSCIAVAYEAAPLSCPGDGGPASLAQFNAPTSVLAAPAATNLSLWIVDTGNNVVRAVRAAGGSIATVAGNGTATYFGDGGAATLASLSAPWGVTSDGANGFLVTDTGNAIIRRVAASGLITLFAGAPRQAGYVGDGGPATRARLNTPRGAFESE